MKKILKFLIIFLLFPSWVYALEIELNSENVLLYNLNDHKIIYQKNSDENIRIASLTKVITTLVALENIEDLNSAVILTEEVFEGLAERDAATAGFKVDEIVTYKDLLYGTMLPSGADATRALAINLFGSEEMFVNEMNDLVKRLNLNNTHFINTSGLDEDGQKATLDDFLEIMLYALKNDQFQEIFYASNYETSNGRLFFRNTFLSSSIKYDIDTSYILGGKTGYTNKAGLCFVSHAKYNDVNLLLITAGAPVDDNIYPYNILDSANAYNYYYDNYKYHSIINRNEIITKIPTKNAKEKEIYLIYQDYEIKKILNKDFNKSELTYTFNLPDYISYNHLIDESVGTFNIYFNDELLFEGNLYLINKLNFSLFEYLKSNIIVIIITILIVIGIVFKNYYRKLNKNN